MSENQSMRSDQYLAFRLDEETFGVNISQTLEILEYKKISKIPRTPDYLSGVTNLRGKAVPVIDMRIKLGIEKGDITVDTGIIVMNIVTNDEKIILGALVDAVCEVIDIEPVNIEPAPKIGTKLNIDFIEGIGKKDNQFIIILNVDRIFTYEELNEVQQYGIDKSLLQVN